MIFKVTCDMLMKVYAVFAHHVVLCSRVGEQVGMGACSFASTDERQGVLGNAYWVVVSKNDEQATFEVSGTQGEIVVTITFGIGLGRIHVAFAVHHFIIAPVDDRTSGNSDLEDIRIVCHERYGHKSSVAPSVYSKSVGIYVR